MKQMVTHLSPSGTKRLHMLVSPHLRSWKGLPRMEHSTRFGVTWMRANSMLLYVQPGIKNSLRSNDQKIIKFGIIKRRDVPPPKVCVHVSTPPLTNHTLLPSLVCKSQVITRNGKHGNFTRRLQGIKTGIRPKQTRTTVNMEFVPPSHHGKRCGFSVSQNQVGHLVLIEIF